MSDHSLRQTFWTAAVIMFCAFLLSLYFMRTYAPAAESGDREAEGRMSEA